MHSTMSVMSNFKQEEGNRGNPKEGKIHFSVTTKAYFRKVASAACTNTEECSSSLMMSKNLEISQIDVNTIDNDIEHYTVDRSNKVKIVSTLYSTPELLTKNENKTNRTRRNTLMTERERNAFSISTPNRTESLTDVFFLNGNEELKRSLATVFERILNSTPERNSYNIAVHLKKPLIQVKSKSYINKNISKRSVFKQKNENSFKTTFIKNKPIPQPLPQVHSGFKVLPKVIPLERIDRGYSDSFMMLRDTDHEREDDVDPVSKIFDKEFLFGGNLGDRSPTEFPIVDIDFDYNADYDYEKTNHPSNEESSNEQTSNEENSNEESSISEYSIEESSNEEQGSEEIVQEVKEEDVHESSERSSGLDANVKENGELIISTIQQGKKEESKEEVEEEEEEENEEEDVVREPPMIVLYNGGDSKQLQPAFEYLLTHGDLDPRYILKDPLAGPLATRGFNHNFQAMRGAPLQGNVVRPSSRYPIVGGFNTTQIHAILQTGQLPSTVPGNGTATVGVLPVPVAPAAPARHAGPVNMETFVARPYRSHNMYIPRPMPSHIINSNTWKGRRPVRRPSMVGPVIGPSALTLSTSPRYGPSYRGGGHLVKYRGNRNHMARYRPINVGIPRFTKLTILKRRNSIEEPFLDGSTISYNGGHLPDLTTNKKK